VCHDSKVSQNPLWRLLKELYIGETRKSFERRKKNAFEMKKLERIRKQTCMELLTYSKINFDARQIIDKENKSIRKNLDSWQTAVGNNSDNISKPLPQQYYVIL
jgi:hypothetical protein